MDTVATTDIILREAATLIRCSGLSQGARARTADGLEIGVHVKSPGKRFCLQGAMLMAYEKARKSGYVVLDDGLHWRSVVEDELIRRGFLRGVAEFNDTHGRTADDVAELLESVARTVTKPCQA